MYRRILLAYDGSAEGRNALREGALLAKHCKSQVYFLSIVPESSGVRLAEGAFPGPVAHQQQTCRAIFEEGVQKLRQLGFDPVARFVVGEPAQVIAGVAREAKVDLVVVGHRKQSLIARWWSGSTGAYLSDHLDCSLLISRNTISDEAFRSELESDATPAA